jgi:hypothetical protein
MTYRSDLDALTARKTALEAEVRDRTRELDEARRLVEEVEARARLPVLDQIRVAAPCSAAWDAMTGDDRVRACGDCHKNVYNLSELTRDEAEALIRAKEGRLCVRYFQRSDGTILLKDCAVGVKRRRRRRLVGAGVAASLAGAALAYVKWADVPVEQIQADLHERLHHDVVMGVVAPPPRPVTPQPPRPVLGQMIQGGREAAPALREVKGDIDVRPLLRAER